MTTQASSGFNMEKVIKSEKKVLEPGEDGDIAHASAVGNGKIPENDDRKEGNETLNKCKPEDLSVHPASPTTHSGTCKPSGQATPSDVLLEGEATTAKNGTAIHVGSYRTGNCLTGSRSAIGENSEEMTPRNDTGGIHAKVNQGQATTASSEKSEPQCFGNPPSQSRYQSHPISAELTNQAENSSRKVSCIRIPPDSQCRSDTLAQSGAPNSNPHQNKEESRMSMGSASDSPQENSTQGAVVRSCSLAHADSAPNEQPARKSELRVEKYPADTDVHRKDAVTDPSTELLDAPSEVDENQNNVPSKAESCVENADAVSIAVTDDTDAYPNEAVTDPSTKLLHTQPEVDENQNNAPSRAESCVENAYAVGRAVTDDTDVYRNDAVTDPSTELLNTQPEVDENQNIAPSRAESCVKNADEASRAITDDTDVYRNDAVTDPSIELLNTRQEVDENRHNAPSIAESCVEIEDEASRAVTDDTDVYRNDAATDPSTELLNTQPEVDENQNNAPSIVKPCEENADAASSAFTDGIRPTCEGVKLKLVCFTDVKLAFHVATFFREKNGKTEEIPRGAKASPHQCTAESRLRCITTILKKFSAEFAQNLLLHVTHSIHRMRAEKIVLGDLRLENIFIETSRNQLFIEDNGKRDRNGDTSCTNDIFCLGKIYLGILAGVDFQNPAAAASGNSDIKCPEQALALDLVSSMQRPEDPITTTEILKHPFHWDTRKKIGFLVNAFDYMKHRSDSDGENQHFDGSTDGRNLSKRNIPEGGWINALRLSDDEVNKIKKLRTNIDVAQNTISNKAFKKDNPKLEPIFNTHSFYDLLRFFRNRQAHFWEDGENIRLCFGGKFEGFWKFFAERFPTLLLHTYDMIKEKPSLLDGEDPIFLNEEACCKPLTNINWEKSFSKPMNN